MLSPICTATPPRPTGFAMLRKRSADKNLSSLALSPTAFHTVYGTEISCQVFSCSGQRFHKALASEQVGKYRFRQHRRHGIAYLGKF
jgi:hypothetical protein